MNDEQIPPFEPPSSFIVHRSNEAYGAFAYAYDQALGSRFFRAVRKLLVAILDRYPASERTHLDLACGTGQNALYLARLGYHVDAWDISEVALDLLRAQLEASGQSVGVTLRQVDLDLASIPTTTYDLVLDINFLERRLFHAMAEALRPYGLLLVRVLMRKPAGDDRTPAYLLAPGELQAAFAQLETLEYIEDPLEGCAAVVARRTAHL